MNFVSGNKSLLILGLAGIILLLVLLKILMRDSNNIGRDAVYGARGTDDLPSNMFVQLVDRYKSFYKYLFN